MTTSSLPAQDAERRGDLERILTVLRRRLGLIVLCIVVVGAGALGASLLQEKEYSASASLLFRDPGFAEDLFGAGTGAPNTDATREAATNEQLVGLEVVAGLTARKLKGLSREEVADMVSVAGEGEADVVSVTATSPSPAQAQRVANTFARQFIAFRARADRSRLIQAKRLADREYNRLPPGQRAGVRGEALSRAAERLGVLASLQTGNAELVQPADLPSSPSSPATARNTLLGLLVGLLLGLGLAFLLEQLNRRLRDPEEAREAFGLPLLATVPESKAIMAPDETAVVPDLPFVENECFHMLQASLRYFNVDEEIRTVLLTSYGAEIGKSTVAWNLARVAAASAKVVLVEADLRNPSIARQRRMTSGPGLAELLTRQVDLDAAIKSRPLAAHGAGGNGAGTRSLDVIVAGAIPPNPAELLASEAMGEVLIRLRARYDLVVVDTAPLAVVSDAFPLLREVDGAIVVARMGRTTKEDAERMQDLLGRLDATVLGLVANAVKSGRRDRYGYGYYDGRVAARQAEPVATPPPR
jgi:tyrosine-protein kinase